GSGDVKYHMGYGSVVIDGLIGVRCHYAAVAHMIFYVTAAHGLVRLGRSFELTEDLLIGLAHDIGQDVEAASMCHTDHDFLYGMSGGSIDNSVEGGNGCFAAFQREPFLSYVFGMQEFLKQDGLIELLEDVLFLFQRKGVEE